MCELSFLLNDQIETLSANHLKCLVCSLTSTFDNIYPFLCVSILHFLENIEKIVLNIYNKKDALLLLVESSSCVVYVKIMHSAFILRINQSKSSNIFLKLLHNACRKIVRVFSFISKYSSMVSCSFKFQIDQLNCYLLYFQKNAYLL